MKVLHIEDYPTRADVEREYPGWIVEIVDDGWVVFETIQDHKTWLKL